MTKPIIASLAIMATVLTLSGCGQSDTNTTTETMTETGTIHTGSVGEKDIFSIAECNTYVNVMNCIIDKGPAEGRDAGKDMMDKLLVAWKALTPEQLQTACDATMKVMTEQKDAIEQMGCKVE